MPVLDRGKSSETFTWEPTEAHRQQARANHGQTLERLRERGGLSWTELYVMLRGMGLFTVAHTPENKAKAKAWIVAQGIGRAS